MKRNLRKAFAFILALTMVVSLFACGKKDANPDGGDSSSDDTFTIAYIGPLTGEASAWGTPEADAEVAGRSGQRRGRHCREKGDSQYL